jgi:ubiquinone/menaquinone biosynthesis C-methylase UbiE
MKSIDKSREAVKIYDKIALKYLEKFRKPSAFLNKFVSFLPKSARVLDVGCGPGTDSIYLKTKGLNVEGIDLSKKMIKIARQRSSSIKFKVMDMRSLKYPDNFFDGLVVAYSLIHIPSKDIQKTLKELKRVLKNSGIIYFGLQEGKGERFLETPLNPKYKMFLHFFTMREFITLLKKHGFEVVFTAKLKPKSKEEFPCNKLFIIARKIK